MRGFATWAVRVPPTLTLILKIHSQGFCFPLLSPPLGAALCYIRMARHAWGLGHTRLLGHGWWIANDGIHAGLFV
ncbi:MAG: hypothetical protein RSI33_09685 [Clostridia bacterium]